MNGSTHEKPAGGLLRAGWAAWVLAGILASVATADEPVYYAIKLDDKLIGYAESRTLSVTQDGRQLTRLQARTMLKISLLGQERTTLLESDTDMQAESGALVAYRMTDTTNDVVRHVDVEFGDTTARSWTYRKGDPRGDGVETALPDGAVILGGNNFAHWQLVLKAAAAHGGEGAAIVPVFLPDARQVDRLELARGEPVRVTVAGEARRCTSWRIASANMVLLADADSAQLVRMELPAQRTVIEMVDESVVKLAQKSAAEEVLARHFAQSNVLFDDLLAVERMEAEIDVQVIGVENDVSVLTTANQSFDGRKSASQVQGTVSIRATAYAAQDSPAFPAETRAEFAQWLEPSPFIESDHASIEAQAAELTRGAKTRWEAVERIGQWIYREIKYTIADTPSARLALEKKTGDCGPHSTLMVAMLRAAGIPARLVGGLVYTPTFGGSFGQHAWVEVHMGDDGWVAMDPTTGEFDRLSATHIKLFEGLGGVVPQSIKVLSFDPPNRQVPPAPRGAPRPLAWKLGRPYTFKYLQGDKDIGQETFTITQVERDGVEAFELTSDLELTINPAASLESHTTLVVAPDARPLTFTRDFDAQMKKTRIECTFEGRMAKEKISGSTNLSRDVPVPEGAYCFDNNLMGCFVLICSQLVLEPGKDVTINTFHPSSLQIIALTLTPGPPAPITIGGREIECFECKVAPIDNTFWITGDGRFVRAKQGDLVIEVTGIDE